MLVTGISIDTYRSIVSTVSDAEYDGNVKVHADYTVYTDNRFRARHDVASSRGAGARRSGSGRRGPWACWHVSRDIMAAIFEANPHARVQTALATYRGLADFEGKFPDTYYTNAGSMMSPASFGDLCEC